MDKEKFLNIIQRIEEYKKTLNNLDLDYGIDISGSYFCETIDTLTQCLIETNFAEGGIKCIEWYFNEDRHTNVFPDIYVDGLFNRCVIKTPEDLWDYVKGFLIRKQE